MKTIGLLLLSGIILAGFSLMVGCSAPKPEEITGEWIPASGSPEVIKNAFLSKPISLTEQPYFVFNADGSFVVEHFPEVLVGLHDSAKIISGKGKWFIDKYQGSNVVKLRFTEGINIETQIWISKGIKSIKLYFWIEEEGGDRFEFVKNILQKKRNEANTKKL